MKKEITLKNGIKVYLQDIKGSTAEIRVLIKTGSVNEEKEEEGISHFVEHMLFNGSKSYPNRGDVALSAGDLGAKLNAFTSNDITCYMISMMSEFVKDGLHILHDMIFNPLFIEEEIVKEKDIIAEEINISKDKVKNDFYTKINSSLFNDKYNFNVLGPEETIRTFNHLKLKKYYEKWYRSTNIVLFVTADLNGFEEVNEEILKTFGTVEKKEMEVIKKIETYNFEDMSEVRFEDKKIESADVRILFDVKDIIKDAKSYYTASILLQILGKGADSRLFNDVREEKMLCYSCSFSMNPFINPIVTMSLGTNPVKVERSLEAMFEFINKNIEKPITEKELVSRTRKCIMEVLTANVFMKTIMSAMNYPLLQNDLTSEEIIDIYKNVTLEEINDMLIKMLKSKKYINIITKPREN